MATISVHNGTSVHRAHNLRCSNVLGSQTHIDPNGIHETWYDESEADAYIRLFQDAVDEYNERQTREERFIKNYHTKIANSGQQNTAYELIVGVYGSDCSTETGYKILRQYYDEWRKRNPCLEMIGTYYHADEEGDPHIHLSYVPVATGYTKGVKKQPGMRRALEQQGFAKNGKETPQIAWERSEQAYLESLCNQYGISVTHPGGRKKHFSVEEYKESKEKERKRNIAANTTELNERPALKSNRVTVDADALTVLKERETEYLKYQTEPSIRTRSAVLKRRKDDLDRQEEELYKKEVELNEKKRSFMQYEHKLKSDCDLYRQEVTFLRALLAKIAETLYEILSRFTLPPLLMAILQKTAEKIDDVLGTDRDIKHGRDER